MVLDSCKCHNRFSAECQLELDQENDAINCKSEVTDSCLAAVKNWALAYKNCDNADDPECKDQDPNYAASQKTWQSCSTLSVAGIILQADTNIINLFL